MYLGFEVFTAVTMKNAVFWDVLFAAIGIAERLQRSLTLINNLTLQQ
jgi:hypothetical protein